MALDRTRPWAEEHRGGIYPELVQDGRRYSYGGQPLDPETEPAAARVIQGDAPDDDLEQRHWSVIKSLVEINGGIFTDRARGIDYIRGHSDAAT